MRGCGGVLAGWGCGLVVLAAVVLGLLYWLALPRLDVILEDSVRRAYLLPPSSTVLIERGSLLDTLEGQVKRVYVESPESKLDGVVVADLRLLAEGVDFDMAKTLLAQSAVLDEVIHGEINFSIKETALQELWADELRGQGLTDAAVSVGKQGVALTGIADLKLAKVPVAVSGKFVEQTGQRIKLELDQFSLSGVKLANGDLKTALAALAPAIDLSRFHMDVEIDRIAHTDGAVAVTARTRSLADRLKTDQEQLQAEPPTVAGQQLKLPKLDELVRLFIEQPAAESDEAKQAEPSNGETNQQQAGAGNE
jgi:hypothetical protein